MILKKINLQFLRKKFFGESFNQFQWVVFVFAVCII